MKNFIVGKIKSLFRRNKKGNETQTQAQIQTVVTKDETLSFTKKIVALVLINGVFWVWCSYILAFLGMSDIAETLSSQVVTVLLGTGLGYFLKSLIENISKYRSLNGDAFNIANVVNEIQQEVQDGLNIEMQNDEDNDNIINMEDNIESNIENNDESFNGSQEIEAFDKDYTDEYKQLMYNKIINDCTTEIDEL